MGKNVATVQIIELEFYFKLFKWQTEELFLLKKSIDFYIFLYF